MLQKYLGKSRKITLLAGMPNQVVGLESLHCQVLAWDLSWWLVYNVALSNLSLLSIQGQVTFEVT